MDTQSMNLSKKNALSIFGWLAFVAFYESVVFLLKTWSINSRSYLVSLNWQPLVYLVLIGVIVFGVNFLAYVLSWRLVVFPISRRGGVNNARLKYPLFLEWLTLCFAVFLFSLPVAFLIQFLPALLPLSENTVDVITSIWQALVSLWLYRDKVLSYLSESSDPVKNAESQSAVPS